ncbi:hypothetical protein ACQ4J5_003226 [Vibrio cholerae]
MFDSSFRPLLVNPKPVKIQPHAGARGTNQLVSVVRDDYLQIWPDNADDISVTHRDHDFVSPDQKRLIHAAKFA